MKKIIILLFFAFSAITVLCAQITVSGILDSTVSLNAGAGDAPVFSFGMEEYANIRFQSRIRDRAAVYGAVNLIAIAGNYAANAALMAGVPAGESIFYKDNNDEVKQAYIINGGYFQKQGYAPPGISPSVFVAGENYAAGIELERLYFRLRGERMDFDGGLMRLPFGYGQIWGPSDFLNPRNPLKPDARARGILGGAITWYPADDLKLLIFYSAPRDPFSQGAKGSFAGLSADKHWDKASLQGLYSFETPSGNSPFGVHRIGISVKADLLAGLVVDALYSYNHEKMKESNNSFLDGLSFSIGADYSFLDGNLIVMSEYLFNGGISSTAFGYGGSFSNNHYLYAGLTYRFNDFTNMNAAVICSFDDVSFTHVISINRELFQGAALTVTAQVPMDRYLFNANSIRGELGPLNARSYFNCNARIRLRF